MGTCCHAVRDTVYMWAMCGVVQAEHHLALAKLYDCAGYPSEMIAPEDIAALHPLLDTSSLQAVRTHAHTCTHTVHTPAACHCVHCHRCGNSDHDASCVAHSCLPSR